MRTTVSIDEGLLEQAKAAAVSSRRTLGDVVNDALRMLFADRADARLPVHLTTDGGSGLRSGVDLEAKDALAELLDAPEPSDVRAAR